jgi:hypothetical protein
LMTQHDIGVITLLGEVCAWQEEFVQCKRFDEFRVLP